MRFGVLLLVLGLGTFVLNAFDYEFRVLAWADDYQPWFSIALAVVGAVIVAATAMRRKSAQPAQPGN
jgi:hypothetical protein